MVDIIERGLNKSETAHLFRVSLSSVKRYTKMAREGKPLAPRKAPGKRPKINERSKQLLEDYLKMRPVASHSERREFLEQATG